MNLLGVRAANRAARLSRTGHIRCGMDRSGAPERDEVEQCSLKVVGELG